ncbi:hypothetical protein ZWY2020_055838 [Hordeum vulgare]|nr:hypothetical protein ZWY2020_055838 [Hordeum vulgare]
MLARRFDQGIDSAENEREEEGGAPAPNAAACRMPALEDSEETTQQPRDFTSRRRRPTPLRRRTSSDIPRRPSVLLEPGCAAFSLVLFHTPDRRLLRFRARLPFSRVDGVLTSDGAISEILVNDIFSGAQACLPAAAFSPSPDRRLPFFKAVGVLTSDGAAVIADGATDEILANDVFSQTQPASPSLTAYHLILSGVYVFAPATDRTEIQYCSLWYAHSFTGSGRPQHSHRPQRTVAAT